MSTNYGYGCSTCGASEIIDNARYYHVPALHVMLDNLDAFVSRGIVHSYPILQHETESAIGFAIEHRRWGHTVAVRNEYVARGRLQWR